MADKVGSGRKSEYTVPGLKVAEGHKGGQDPSNAPTRAE
ncbi:hypothetical protein CLV47_106131 [Antricoccus suffuscus]|uniref:Uncharacterized protein n=1 Tax=Antricoccus suffuscus TaxID=1629062 RepID=A0A2T1A0X5_9ACTN|nr:hypothetical protein CLV47_106131 [Antricoccus suffuscus]